MGNYRQVLTVIIVVNKVMRLKTLAYQLDEEAKQENAKKRRIQKREEYSKNAENYVDEGRS